MVQIGPPAFAYLIRHPLRRIRVVAEIILAGGEHGRVRVIAEIAYRKDRDLDAFATRLERLRHDEALLCELLVMEESSDIAAGRRDHAHVRESVALLQEARVRQPALDRKGAFLHHVADRSQAARSV